MTTSRRIGAPGAGVPEEPFERPDEDRVQSDPHSADEHVDPSDERERDTMRMRQLGHTGIEVSADRLGSGAA